MSAFSDAYKEVLLAVQPDDTPALTHGDGTTQDATKELDQIILNSARGSLWAASTNYTYGQMVFPTARNGHRYRVVTPGTSGSAEPTWGTSTESQTANGSVVFEEAGQDYSSIYDTRKAKYDAWNLKAAKAAVKNQTISDGRGQANSYLYLDCVRERDKYVSIGVS